MLDWLRALCMSFPHTTEVMQWEALVFKVGGKMFAVAALEPERHFLSIKCADEKFAEMIERPGIVPAPYLARAKWIAFEKDAAISRQELKLLVRESYDLVLAKLPRKAREELVKPAPKPRKRPRK